MGLSAKVGSFNTGTGAVTTTVAVSDVGFQPTFVIFWWTKSTTTGTTDEVVGNHISSGVGFAVSATDRCCMAIQSEDASASSDTDDVWYSSACITTRTISGSADGVLDFQSMDTGGFTLVVDDAFTASYHIHYMAFGGTDITNATTGVKAVPGVTGNDETTGLGFQPDIVFFLGNSSVTDATNNTSGSLSFGAAMSSSSRRVSLLNVIHGLQTMEAKSYSYDGECIAIGGTATGEVTEARADFVSMNSGGFTINWLEVDAGRSYAYIAIKGGNWLIGDLLTQTDTTTDIVESGFGFAPSGALLVSHCNTKSTQDTIQAHASLSIGAFNSTTSRGAQASYMEDATAESECTYAVEHDEVYINISNADAVQGLMDVKSVDSGGFTCIMDDADPAQAYVWYVAAGPVATGTQTSDQQAAYLKGQTSGSDNQLAYTRGKDTSTDNQLAYLCGRATDSDQQAAYLRGTDNATDQQPAYLFGVITATDQQAAYLSAQATDSDQQPAYLRGAASGVDQQAAYLFSVTGAIAQQAAYLAAQASAAAQQAAYLCGRQTDSDQQAAYLSGITGALDQQAAYLAGVATGSAQQAAYLNAVAAQFQTSDQQAAYLRGAESATDQQAAYLCGAASATDQQPAYLFGVISATDAQAAYLFAEATSTNQQPAYLRGATSATDQQAAYLAGIMASQQAAYLRGDILATVFRAGSITSAAGGDTIRSPRQAGTVLSPQPGRVKG